MIDRGIKLLLTVLLAAFVSQACTDVPSDFRCRVDVECVVGEIQGVCQPKGRCSFPDHLCETGQRFAEFVPGGVGGYCVPAVEDGPPPDDGGPSPDLG